MTDVETRLRSTLRELAPEPPEHLDLVGGVRARAGAVRRERWVTALAAVAVLAAVVAVPALLPRGGTRGVGPVHAPVAPFPDWPRRGDLAGAPAVERGAVAAWDKRLRAVGTGRTAAPRVLYAGGGDHPVVVLYGHADVGGDRLVVVTGGGPDVWSVYADRPAPPPAIGAVTIVLDPPETESYDESVPCDAGPGYSATSSRILVLADPGVTVARWRIEGFQPATCNGNGSATPWQRLPMHDGSLMVSAPLGRRGSLTFQVEGPRPASGSPMVYGPSAGDYGGVRTHPFVPKLNGRAPLDWNYRSDYSGGMRVGQHVRVGPSRPCMTVWDASLPDGTPAAFCGTAEGSALLVAEDRDGVLRRYLDARIDPTQRLYAAVVDGHEGRWLVVVGAPDLTEATLVDGRARRKVPLRHGSGFLRLTALPSGLAFVEGPPASSRLVPVPPLDGRPLPPA